MIFIIILLVIFVCYYFYYERIEKPKSIINQGKREYEYSKISLLVSKHPQVREKFNAFKNEQIEKINKINIEISTTHPLEMGSVKVIFGKEVNIYSYQDAEYFTVQLKSFISKLESNPSHLKFINSIMEQQKDSINKKKSEFIIDENNFKLLYFELKPLLTNIFPDRKKENYLNNSYSKKTKEEIIADIINFQKVSDVEAINVFEKITSCKYDKAIISRTGNKYFLDEEEILFKFEPRYISAY